MGFIIWLYFKKLKKSLKIQIFRIFCELYAEMTSESLDFYLRLLRHGVHGQEDYPQSLYFRNLRSHPKAAAFGCPKDEYPSPQSQKTGDFCKTTEPIKIARYLIARYL